MNNIQESDSLFPYDLGQSEILTGTPRLLWRASVMHPVKCTAAVVSQVKRNGQNLSRLIPTWTSVKNIAADGYKYP
jgi:hypothetical protein